MPARRRVNTTERIVAIPTMVFPGTSRLGTWRAVASILILAIYWPLAQLILSPVYGSIPTSLYHSSGVVTVQLLAISILSFAAKQLPANIQTWSPVIALCIPTVHTFLFRWSGAFGAIYGPIISNALTIYPLALSSAIGISQILSSPWAPSAGRSGTARAVLVSFYFIVGFLTFRLDLLSLVIRITSSYRFMTRSGLQLLLAVLYAILFPSKRLLLAIPSLMHAFSYNIHMPFPWSLSRLNQTLATESTFIILERQESVTGYISVLENTKENFRVMRCDHSILGGIWTELPPGVEQSAVVKEPIYSVFTMLEAVRLVESDPKVAPTDDPGFGPGGMQEPVKQALVIGLGIGTAPAALTAHGVNTTTIELDPVVGDFAKRYFYLPSNHTTVIEDALTYIDREAAADRHYDYIIHDVFTGGAEPVILFTQEFLIGLRTLLQSDGVIAINYAGDLLSPSARLVVRTILSVFHTCRIFREDAPPDSSTREEAKLDFTNIVIFCTQGSSRIAFRKPVEADYLGSSSRRHYLMPRFETDQSAFLQPVDNESLLDYRTMRKMEDWQEKSAVGHWGIMRSVLPAVVWENW